MAVTKKSKTTKLSSKKEVKEIITSQLEIALLDFKKEIGEDEFHLRLKKAVKELTKNLKTTPSNGKVNTKTEKEPIAEKLPSKGKKAANKKSEKKKVVKAKHSSTPAEVN